MVFFKIRQQKGPRIAWSQCCGSGSGIRDWVPFWPLDPRSGIRNDPGSQTHIFESLVTTFWVKSSIILWNLAQIFSWAVQNLNNFTFCEICGYKKMFDKNFFPPLSFLPVFGSGIRDPGSGMGKNQDPGSGINIPDPPHCMEQKTRVFC